MKTAMYVSLTVIIMLSFLSVNSKCYSQELSTEEWITQRIKELDKELKLNDKQEEQIRKIYSDSMERMAQRRGDRPAPRGGRTGMFGGAFGRFGQIDSEIEAVLTDEQVELYRAFNLKQQVDTRMARLDEALTLTDDQKVKIRKIVEQDIKKTNEIFAEMRESGADRQTMFGEIRDQREATNKAIAAVLTKEQAAIFNDMNQRMGQRQRR